MTESEQKSREASTAPIEPEKLLRQLARYLKVCQAKQAADGNKKAAVFPNLAGFCRFLGCGLSELEELRLTHPKILDRILAILEDEALNLLLSPTVLSAYLKRRLNYTEKSEEKCDSADCGEMHLIFEHDILEDGE